MTIHARFLAQCLRTPWAMDPMAMAGFATMLVRAYGQKAGVVAYDEHEQDTAGPAAKTSGIAARPGSTIALINVFGPIMQRASDFGPCEAGTGAEDISRALDEAANDSTADQILLRISSPGGSVFGIQEVGDKIRSLRATKPIVGIADSMAASAAYWLLSQCSEAYCTPGGMVGSVGVYNCHEDVSKAMDEMGVKLTFVTAGRYKVEGNPYEPLGEEARAELQSQVSAYYSKFTGAVAKGRGVPVEKVRSDFGEGRMLLADAAKAAGMVDDVMTFQDVVRKMQRQAKPAGRTAQQRAQARQREIEAGAV